MYKISVTTVDQFVKYLNSDTMTDEELIDRLIGKFQGNKFTELGTAFHFCLQNPGETYKPFELESGTIYQYEYNGICFDDLMMTECLNKLNWDIPAFEVREEKIYNSSYGEVKMIGKADQLCLNYVQEIKSCWTQYKYDNYKDSIQWKFYIDMFGVNTCKYIVYQFFENANGINLNQIHEFQFFKYDKLETDLINTIDNFINFIKEKNIENHFII